MNTTQVQRGHISGSLKSSGGFDNNLAGRKGQSFEKNKEERPSLINIVGI